jgi:hypothetical protein
MAHLSWARPTILTLMIVIAISACLLAAVVQDDWQLVVIIIAGLSELGVTRLMVPVRIPSNEKS